MQLRCNAVASLRKGVALFHKVFNWKLALISAGFNGSVVLLFNSHHGWYEALWAGGWQAPASFIATGVTGRLVQYFSRIREPLPSYFWGSLIPAMLTLIGSVAVHLYNGTPELMTSCAWPTFVSYTTSFATNFGTRRSWKWIQPS